MWFFAVAAPGLENLLLEELREIGLADARALEGGVEFSGELSAAWRVNLHSRLAGRVLLRLASFHATSFPALQARCRALDWPRWLPAGAPVRVRAATHRSRLHHAGHLARALETVLREVLGPPVAQEPIQTLYLRLENDQVQLSLDSSGELLHQRGYREEAGAAPLRETLAAASLRLARWRPEEPLFDPFCGSGTFPVEAALQALGVPPGRHRRFAFASWPGHDEAGWRSLLAEADAARRAESPAPILGADADPAALERARRNAARAGVAEAVSWRQAPLAESTPPEGPPGLVIANPPWGGRLASPARARRLYAELGNVLSARFRGWRAAVLCPDRKSAAALNLLVTGHHPLPAGGRRVDLVLVTV